SIKLAKSGNKFCSILFGLGRCCLAQFNEVWVNFCFGNETYQNLIVGGSRCCRKAANARKRREREGPDRNPQTGQSGLRSPAESSRFFGFLACLTGDQCASIYDGVGR